MKKEIPKMLKDVKGLVIKSTKTGRRYLLHDKDLSGKDIYVTIEITDNTPKDESSKKIESARIKLNAKKSCICFDTLVTQYTTMRNLSKQTEKSIIVALRGFGLDNDCNKKSVENIIKFRIYHINPPFFLKIRSLSRIPTNSLSGCRRSISSAA